jgi:gliding motility-associated-like protein
MDCGCGLFLPKAFTPNNDGTNDVFRPRSDCITNYEMKVFNRWGEMVFKGNEQNIGWNGKFKGRNCPAEVYAYIVWYNTESNKRIMKSGNVSLIR